jgi:hypothetical protein
MFPYRIGLILSIGIKIEFYTTDPVTIAFPYRTGLILRKSVFRTGKRGMDKGSIVSIPNRSDFKF